MGAPKKTTHGKDVQIAPLPDMNFRLSRMKILMAVNFPKLGGIDSKTHKKLKRVVLKKILTPCGYSNKEAIGFFKKRTGEADRLIEYIRFRAVQMLEIIEDVSKTDPGLKGMKMAKIDVSRFYVFCPDAYAMAVEGGQEADQDGMEYVIRFSMPFLTFLYSGNAKFKSMEALVGFIDSILLHEIVHCLGSMDHGKQFHKFLNRLTKIMGIPKIIG